MPADMLFSNILLVSHPKLHEAGVLVKDISTAILQSGRSVKIGMLDNEEIRTQIRSGVFDLVIALGGDGTMLRAGILCASPKKPLLGINLGRFGFLTEIQGGQFQTVFPKLFSGDYWIENRMMLAAEQWRSNTQLGSWEVLNDVVVARGNNVRPVHLITHVDGRYLTTYVADGLIAATATGSTAYALAAGGPILPPEMRNILLVPVAPHLSIDRAIILAEGSTVNIVINTTHQAVMSPDGQLSIDLQDEDRIDVRASKNSVQFIRFQDPGYFYRNLTPHMSQNPATGSQR